ncbi:conjugal transfer protein TraN (plasmid) [Vibrio coralliilyticus]|nr:conjugal transfer protein TraN [Vibrio coralliilyticus]
MKNIIIMGILGLFCVKALASQDQSFKDTAHWAKQTSQSMLTPNNIPLNISDYCKDVSCQNQVANPSEASLTDSTMADKKTEAMANDELAQGIQNNLNKERPDFKNDQQMRFALIAQENAYEISHDVSNKYVNCDSGEQCLFDEQAKFCYAPTRLPVPCNKVPVFSEETTPHIQSRMCRFDSNNMWQESWNGGWQFPVWNGKLTFLYPDKDAIFTKGAFRYKTNKGMGDIYSHKYEICISIKTCPNGYINRGSDCAKNNVSWAANCSLIQECKPISERCIEPRATRTINGVPTTLDCWKYEILHECDLPSSCDALAECAEDKRECSLEQNGVCIEEKITKLCTTKNCRQVTLQCGEQSYCLDGDCYDATPKRNDEFDKSAAALAGLGEAAKGLGDPPKIFTGKPMKCAKKAVGFSDCCKDGGWGTDIGLDQCSEEEKALGEAKDKGLTIYVGEYCADKILGKCIRTKRSYCSYDSKLGKIIQQQGALSQLGKTLGSAENPTCAPLTPEELSDINFDHIDFTEFYPELHDNINLPDPNIIKQRIQSAVGG